ncbi:SRPBCC family protein [Crenobacter sp. SG2303]|uniref:SRPBCC family protein n=1 Tax=Crenobacter oryzisoli TaxID=3056844 RepID=A0ABT7XIW4_9NEIS|nr:MULTISPECIES: SRPBCC family protein [unclassified Crenobacter]MDN0073728.1 SRPBCC family protein [Crenobacter sp. SG2303]MDN0082712.1 SRPBCC family protein [Crenobacter sp. SG2305]
MKRKRWRWVVWLAVLLAAFFWLPLPWVAGTRIDNTVDIGRPPDAVFDYVTTPGNWPRWHPSSLAVHGATDHPLRLGERVTEDYLVAGRRGQVVWTVIQYERPRLWVIVGRIHGWQAGTVSYTLTPTSAGTRFDRVFVYGSAPTPFYALLNQLVLRRRIEVESTTAVEHLKSALEAMSAG